MTVRSEVWEAPGSVLSTSHVSQFPGTLQLEEQITLLSPLIGEDIGSRRICIVLSMGGMAGYGAFHQGVRTQSLASQAG